MSKYHKMAEDCPVCGSALYPWEECHACGYVAPVVQKAQNYFEELMNTPFFTYRALSLKPVVYCKVVPGKLYDAGDGLTYVDE